MRSLGSDNHSAVHPKIFEAMIKINSDHDASYGTDVMSHKLGERIQELTGPDWSSFHCFNGTAANVMSLKALVQTYESIVCTDVSHLNLDECGAPEFHIGAKLITVPSKDGKLNLEDLESKVIRRGDQHFSQVRAVSITQPTELGTCYSLKEIKEISGFCKKHKLYLHIDGARLPNALHTLKCELKDFLDFADAVSFGGTKNGLLGSELVLLKKKFSTDFKFIRKQSMQLPSKTRFLAVQFLEFLNDDLYLKIAEHSCSMARHLSDQLEDRTSLKTNYPIQSNAVFVNLPKEMVKQLKAKMFFYIWNEVTNEARLMTSFDTTQEELDSFIDLIVKMETETENSPESEEK